MRIIDKNTDFYDYLQNVYRDNTVTFDRTDSFVLTKEILLKHLPYTRTPPLWVRGFRRAFDFALLQVCNTFWLFLIDAFDEDETGHPQDCKIELLATWQNYGKQRKLIRLDIIDFSWKVSERFKIRQRLTWQDDKDAILENVGVLTNAIDMNEYKVIRSIDSHTVYYGNGLKEEKHIPILKASGMAAFIDPLDIFITIEQYFSLERLDAERTESVGITDVEKAENHGFDKKSSFRGK